MSTPDPIEIFRELFDRASLSTVEPDAMVLATAEARGRPSARYVLLKAFDARSVDPIRPRSWLQSRGRTDP